MIARERITKFALTQIAMTTTIALVAFVHSYQFAYYVEFNPLNGAFQSFNPLHRLAEGQLPFRDFVSYLGTISIYLNYWVFKFFGGTFSASQLASHFLHIFFYGLAVQVLAFLCGLRGLVNSTVVLSVFTLGILPAQGMRPWFPINVFFSKFSELVTPGNSALGLRTALPFVTAAILIAIIRLSHWHWNRWIETLIVAALGIVTGVQVLWSNDYGIPSAFALFIVVPIFLLPRFGLWRVQSVSIYLLSTLLSFLLIGSALTGGHLLDWYEYQRGVSQDQFWYFSSASSAVVFDLRDIYIDWQLAALMACAPLLFMKAVRTGMARYAILLYITLTVVGAGYIATIGGQFFARYFSGAYLVSLFVVPFVIFRITRWALFTWTKKSDMPFPGRGMRRAMAFALVAPALIAAAYDGYLFLSTSIAGLDPRPGFFYVPELGGHLSLQFRPAVNSARNILRDTSDTDPHRRLFSTYATLMDLIAGAVQPSGSDYIIHALGEDQRRHYLASFLDASPPYATTLRESFVPWETWSRRVNWWFYRELLPNYEPVSVTYYNILWKRRSIALESPKTNFSCRISQEGDATTTLVISGGDDRDIYYVDLQITYQATVMPTGIPIIGSRLLLTATENSVKSLSYGVPSDMDRWHLMVEHQSGAESRIRLDIRPTNRAKLKVKECRAQAWISTDEAGLVRNLSPANFSDQNWTNGISIMPGPAQGGYAPAFFVFNRNELQDMLPGDDIIFATKSRRRLEAVKGDQIWVNGPSLSPTVDGFPNAVRAVLR